MAESSDQIDNFVEGLSSKITITYPNGKIVEFGKELAPIDVKDEPHVTWEADPAKYYTLLMYDPDAPSRQDPTLADVKHWLVVNILGCDMSSGEVIAEYAGSGPPKDTGLHRYIFLVYEQKEKLDFDEPKTGKNSRKNRLNWSMRVFKRKYAFERVHAGNYYMAQWDPYVEERKKQFVDD